MTFDIRGSSSIEGPGIPAKLLLWELLCQCRSCLQATLFKAAVLAPRWRGDHEGGEIFEDDRDLTGRVAVHGYVGLANMATKAPPAHVPEKVAAIYREAATCKAVNCWNAAATMFRLVIDLGTRHFVESLPDDAPSRRIRDNLAARVDWLSEHNHIADDLRQLADCIRHDGNDGAHLATIGENEVEDLLDFTEQLLTRLYTVPEAARIAATRTAARRAQSPLIANQTRLNRL